MLHTNASASPDKTPAIVQNLAIVCCTFPALAWPGLACLFANRSSQVAMTRTRDGVTAANQKIFQIAASKIYVLTPFSKMQEWD